MADEPVRRRARPGGQPVRRRSRVAVAAIAAAVAATGIVLTAVLPGDGPPGVPRLPVLGEARDIYDGDFGDPFILPLGGQGGTGDAPGTRDYLLFGTDDPPDHVPTATSPDLIHWTRLPDAVPTLPPWANPDLRRSLTWAPAALRRPDGYRLYVSVQESATRRQCIAVLTAAVPQGPYHDARGTPLVCQQDLGGSIDPSVLTTAGGGLHLLWKSDGNCCGLPVSLWEQTLSADGLAVTGAAHRLLGADLPWQGGIVENPAMIPARSGGYWLFYSGNSFDAAAYATGLAWCRHLEGPCQETSRRPFLAGTPTQFSPGGMEFFLDHDGHLRATFATWNRPSRNGRFFCCRSLDLAPVPRT